MALNEVIAAGLAAGAAKGTELLGKPVEISTRSVARGGWELAGSLGGFTLGCPFAFGAELSGQGVLLLDARQAALMVELMIGNDPAALPADLPEALRDAAAEPIAQMVAAIGEGLGRASRRRVQTASGALNAIAGDSGAAARAAVKEDKILVAACMMSIGGREAGRLALVLAGSQADALAVERPAGAGTGPELQLGAATTVGASTVQPAQFGAFQVTGGGEPAPAPANLDLLMDVQLDVTVELGRAMRKVREVLGLGPGSIVELNKLAGEPVDLLVNGKPIAKCEVVVIDENFAVRIIEILGRDERLAGGL